MSKKTDEIRVKIAKKEEKLGRKLTKSERKSVIRKVEVKYQKRKAIFAALAAIGITVGGVALITSGGKDSQDTPKTTVQDLAENIPEEELGDKATISQEDEFREGIKVSIDNSQIDNQETDQKNYEEVLEDILKDYNDEYGSNLVPSDIKIYKSTPVYLWIDDKEGYRQDNRERYDSSKQTVDDGIGSVYILINGNDNKIIASLGKVDGKITNVDTNYFRSYDGEEYLESDKKVNLTNGKSEEELKSMYTKLSELQQYRKNIKDEIER